jgi:anthranilate synthase component 2
MILLIDNYDSFTFNLAQALRGVGAHIVVHRNDALDVAGVLALGPTAVVISPGPGAPCDAGITPDLIQNLPDEIALLGVCLGHQALVEGLGGELVFDAEPTHGKASLVHHDGSSLFRDLPSPFPAGRYHSLKARRETLPTELCLSAWTEAGEVMAVQHETRPWFGVQFHPESILTPMGTRLLANFANLAGEPSRRVPA